MLSSFRKVNAFISDNAKPEYDQLQVLIKGRIDEVNPNLGDLPQFQFNPGARMIQQGNVVAYMSFDKPIINRPENALILAFRPTSRRDVLLNRTASGTKVSPPGSCNRFSQGYRVGWRSGRTD